MDEHSDLEIRIVSNPRYICAVRLAIESAARSLGAAEQTCGELALVVGEALANVIKHGYQDQTDRPIWVTGSPMQDDGRRCFEVVIEDESQGVDLDQIKSRPLDEVRPGGLGVHLIQCIMDQVEYSHRQDGVGVRLRMRKCIGPANQVAKS